MLTNTAALDLVYKGFKSVYTDAYMLAPSHAQHIAMTVPSVGRDETYSWIGAMPGMREWIGQRQVQNLRTYSFSILNRKFEATVEVRREDIEDDRLGVFKPMFAEMGQNAKRHPDEMLFGLLRNGFSQVCYDGQFFFDVDHPVEGADGVTTLVANTDGGAGTPWFLLDTSRSIRPMIWQERSGYDFQQVTDANDEYVFRNDNYLYGLRARVNAGFGLWQLAWGSRQTLNAANYAAARAAMMGFRADGGRILGVTPTALVVPPALEQAGLDLVNSANGASGASNPWKDTAKLIVSPYLA